MSKYGPTLRSQWLGQQLRQLRMANRHTLKDVGDYIQRDPSSVSRLEAGTYPARVPEVLAYIDLCGIDDADDRQRLVALAREVWRGGWWDGYSKDVASTLVDRMWIESRSTAIRSFEVIVVPGLLQTVEYAETLIRAASPTVSEGQIERWVGARLSRQQILDEDEPPQLTAILDEGILRRSVGGTDIMRPQLEHLLEMGERPNIDVLVLPFGAGVHASPDGGFEVFEMAEPYPEVGYVSSPAGEICVEGVGAKDLSQRYDRLRKAALDSKESAALISAAAEDNGDDAPLKR